MALKCNFTRYEVGTRISFESYESAGSNAKSVIENVRGLERRKDKVSRRYSLLITKPKIELRC